METWKLPFSQHQIGTHTQCDEFHISADNCRKWHMPFLYSKHTIQNHSPCNTMHFKSNETLFEAPPQPPPPQKKNEQRRKYGLILGWVFNLICICDTIILISGQHFKLSRILLPNGIFLSLFAFEVFNFDISAEYHLKMSVENTEWMPSMIKTGEKAFINNVEKRANIKVYRDLFEWVVLFENHARNFSFVCFFFPPVC